MPKKLRAGVCRFCGCTENRACHDPETETCYWVDGRRTMCSACTCPSKAHLRILQDILALVSRKVTLGALSAWTYPERARALRWASAVYLRAGDNAYVRVPAMPRHVARLKEISSI
jgi:hypothetical protein